MQRIVILGGGVGGTLTANLLERKLKRQLGRGEVSITVVDTTGSHIYQPGFMYIAMGGEKAEKLARPERSLLGKRIELITAEALRVDVAAKTVELAGGRKLDFDYLVLATGSRIVPEEIEYFEQEAHHFYSAEAALKLRHALDKFAGGKIVIGIAGMPYKCPPAPLEVAFLIETELRKRKLREKSELHFCSPIGRAFTIESVSEMATPILEKRGIELHTFFNVETLDPARKVVQSLEGEELAYDLLVLVPPHRGAKLVTDSGLAPGGGWLPTDRETLQLKEVRPPNTPDADVPRYPNIFVVGDATDLPLSKAGSTAHFESPIIAERIAAAVAGREPHGKHAKYTGKVMCFFEIGDGKGTLLNFDYNHPPKPPRPGRLWHLGKIIFNKTYWFTVPKGRV